MCRELPPLLFSAATAPECSTRCNRHSPAAWQAAPLLAEPLTGSRSSLAHRNSTCRARGSCQVRIRARKGSSGRWELLLAGPCSTLTLYRDPEKRLGSYFLQQCFHQQLIIFGNDSAKYSSELLSFHDDLRVLHIRRNASLTFHEKHLYVPN